MMIHGKAMIAIPRDATIKPMFIIVKIMIVRRYEEDASNTIASPFASDCDSAAIETKSAVLSVKKKYYDYKCILLAFF